MAEYFVLYLLFFPGLDIQGQLLQLQIFFKAKAVRYYAGGLLGYRKTASGVS